jgi:hypothetical protein
MSAAVPDRSVVGRPALILGGPAAGLFIPSDRGSGCQVNLEGAEVGGCVAVTATRQSHA